MTNAERDYEDDANYSPFDYEPEIDTWEETIKNTIENGTHEELANELRRAYSSCMTAIQRDKELCDTIYERDKLIARLSGQVDAANQRIAQLEDASDFQLDELAKRDRQIRDLRLANPPSPRILQHIADLVGMAIQSGYLDPDNDDERALMSNITQWMEAVRDKKNFIITRPQGDPPVVVEWQKIVRRYQEVLPDTTVRKSIRFVIDHVLKVDKPLHKTAHDVLSEWIKQFAD